MGVGCVRGGCMMACMGHVRTEVPGGGEWGEGRALFKDTEADTYGMHTAN